MDNEKNTENDKRKEGEFSGEPAPRARNRTVMLTPDITGEVRARLAQELGQPLGAASAAHAAFEAQATGHTHHSSADGFTAARRDHPAAAHHTAAPQVAASAFKEGIVWTQETPIIGFLVSYDKNPNGEVAVLRSGRLIITSDKVSGGNFLLIEDSSVSPMHAIMRITGGGEVQVLDQLSEFGTVVQRFGSETEEELSGDKSSLEHGDTIKFGNRKFHVCIVARGDSAQVV